MDSFYEWYHLLEGASHLVMVYIAHKYLKYFMSYRVLNCRQAHWTIWLFEFLHLILLIYEN